jgi:hypothetical protein
MCLQKSLFTDVDAQHALEQGQLALEAELLTLQQQQESVFMEIAAAGGQKDVMLQNSMKRKLFELQTEEIMMKKIQAFIQHDQSKLSTELDPTMRSDLELHLCKMSKRSPEKGGVSDQPSASCFRSRQAPIPSEA